MVKKYNDIICGHDYLEVIEDGKIKNHDILVQLLFNSTQLLEW